MYYQKIEELRPLQFAVGRLYPASLGLNAYAGTRCLSLDYLVEVYSRTDSVSTLSVQMLYPI